MTKQQFILTLACADRIGIVAAVTQLLQQHQGFVLESAQFGDAQTERFFMRVVFNLDADACASFADSFRQHIGEPYAMQWQIHDADYKQRLLLMVSKQSHCLNDVLHRYRSGTLAVDIAAVVSNHTDLEEIVSWYKLPFHHLPINANNKETQEEALLALHADLNIDLIVLARYMQILSPQVVAKLPGRIINIHHSFLPSFKGARPYHQAYSRGVKLIGATAHYVTNDLDEGPIIEQEVVRVNHSHSPEHLSAMGCDIESLVLARALQYHVEQRVLLNGNKTVIL